MGILSNTVTICHYEVNGPLPEGDLAAWVQGRLAERSFQSIDNSSEEVSIGWVHLDDSQGSDFSQEGDFRRDNWLVFSLRRDQRRVPAGLFRAHFDLACRVYHAQNPGLARIAKAKREELKEAVMGSLLARTLPAPAVYDMIWDTRAGIVTFTSISPKVTEILEGYFKQTFEGLTLTPLYPLRRAEGVVDPALLLKLKEANRASNENMLEQIRDNLWIGEDFLLWLLFRTMNEGSEYAVCRPGPAAHGEVFVAYLNDRIVLQGESSGGSQKIAVSGPQDSFREVRAALQGGKVVREGVICLEKGEDFWRFNLKGEIFTFGSFKGPSVRLEREDVADPQREREAVFYERMHIVEEGLQLFDSLLAVFLRERLGDSWGDLQQRVDQWLAEG